MMKRALSIWTAGVAVRLILAFGFGRGTLPLFAAPLALSAGALLVHTCIWYSHPAWWALVLSAGVATKWVRDKLISSP